MKLKKELIAQKDPKSPVSEVFRTLRTNIQFMSTNKRLKTLLVTSTFPGEGKSWVTSNLAVTFAQAGNRVIVIDADMRKGRQYTIFGVSPRPGLSNFLSGVDVQNPDEIDISNYIQKTEIENLLVMSAGNIPPNPSELLVSPQMNRLLEDLKEVCDIIIIDGTPCELVTDSIILSRIVDSTIIVTAHKETKRDNLGKIIKNIQNVGGHLAGVVVNKMPVSVKKYNEKYYYYGTQTPSTTPKETSNNLKKKTEDVLRQNSKNNENINKQDMNKHSKENNYNKSGNTYNYSKENNYKKDIYNGNNIYESKKTYNEPNTYNRKKYNDTNEDLDVPSFIINNKEDEKQNGENTNDILNQINSYINQEKRNLN